MSKLIITKMDIFHRPCLVCAAWEDGKVVELRLHPAGKAESVLNNIYMGQVETVSAGIQAAFVRFQKDEMGYFPLSEAGQVIYGAGRKGNAPLRAGDQILVQVSRDAMKGKLPALSSNLNFTGRFLVLTTGNKKFGLSAKLSGEERKLLSGWLEEEEARSDREYGIVVRTNAAEASKEEILSELQYLKQIYQRVAVQGRSRTSGSLLYETLPFYLSALRDSRSRDLEEIITDLPDVLEKTREYLSENGSGEEEKLRFYEDPLLPLCKLYRLENAVEEIRREKIWLKSGGFLVIQQTEAFVSIDVNSGKYTGKKKTEETFRKINLEAAGEIVRQIRLRNLSGIILVDFINMEHPDHQEELFHVLQKLLKKDPMKGKAVDITPLHIFEMTRKKVRRPVLEDLRELADAE